MKWLIIMIKVGLLTFLGGIVFCGLLFVFSKESLSNQLGMIIPWALIISLMLVCLNILFVFLLYFTVYFLQNRIKMSLLSLKYLLVEIFLLYILFILPIYSIKDSYWIQLLTPFAALYVLWLIIISIINFRHKED